RMHRILPTLSALLLAVFLAACAAPETTAAAPGATDSTVVADTPDATGVPNAPGVPGVPDVAGVPGVPGVPDLDRSCSVDSDCAVKDVGNCCGYFPACVNRDARPDPVAVRAACAASGMASVCGFREVEACSCVASTCEPASAAAVAP